MYLLHTCKSGIFKEHTCLHKKHGEHIKTKYELDSTHEDNLDLEEMLLLDVGG
jgi:hypothetical protein